MAAEEYLGRIRSHLDGSAAVKRLVADRCADEIVAAASVISQCFSGEGKLLLCGNGGSAADCQHMAAEFVSRLSAQMERAALPAIALTTDTSFITAYANDYGYDGVFERQVEGLGKAGDVLIGISTSGGSRNVLRAVEAARRIGMKTIILMGRGGRLADQADIIIAVPSDNQQFIQEAHLAIEHIICDLVERRLFSSDE